MLPCAILITPLSISYWTLKKGTIDEVTWELACSEPLPEKPLRFPQLAPHMLDKSFATYDQKNSRKKSRIRTTIDASLQSRVTSII